MLPKVAPSIAESTASTSVAKTTKTYMAEISIFLIYSTWMDVNAKQGSMEFSD
jgi:hypothetical protein